ncbi:MAG: hypothetical protein V4678_04860 [Patescibacteria group bacterium]
MTEQALATRNLIELGSQLEVNAKCEALMRLMELNSQLDTETDLLEDAEQSNYEERERLVAEMLQDPVPSFGYKFALLQLLYEARTFSSTDSMGTTVDEFVTRDPSRVKADLHFREVTYPSGSVERVVEVPRRDTTELPFFVSLQDGDLRIACSVYERGAYQRREVPTESDAGERLLGEFFRHTIVAGDYLSTRSPQAIASADAQARGFLATKLVEQHSI